MFEEGEDPVEVARPESTWKLLSRWLTPEDGELWRQTSYRFHALVVNQWRKCRVFIAGDAAHQQPPFMGQGMCQGIRDAANLSWKLSAVIKGEEVGPAAQALFETFGEERKAHVRELTTRIKHVGEVIGERNLEKARARDQCLLADCGGVVKDTPRQDMIPRLEAGCLSSKAGTGRGALFPQPRVVDGGGKSSLLDQIFGNGWRLASDARLFVTAEHLWPLTVVQLGTQALHETEGVTALWMRNYDCCAGLVRPENYVFGTASSQHELDEILAEWRTKLGFKTHSKVGAPMSAEAEATS